MGYLITQIIICLLIAALIGFSIGWFLRGLAGNNEHNIYKNNGSSANSLSSTVSLADDVYPEPVTRPPLKSHQIEQIEGIGKGIGKFLRDIEIKNTIELIEKCSTKGGFEYVVTATQTTDSVVLQWVSMANLMRISGVDGQYAELMEASDIKSTQDLARADAQALVLKMQAVNQRERRIPDSIPLPDINMIRQWIKDAKTLAV